MRKSLFRVDDWILNCFNIYISVAMLRCVHLTTEDKCFPVELHLEFTGHCWWRSLTKSRCRSMNELGDLDIWPSFSECKTMALHPWVWVALLTSHPISCCQIHSRGKCGLLEKNTQATIQNEEPRSRWIEALVWYTAQLKFKRVHHGRRLKSPTYNSKYPSI